MKIHTQTQTCFIDCFYASGADKKQDTFGEDKQKDDREDRKYKLNIANNLTNLLKFMVRYSM